jgi:hypothetical protein
MISNGRLCLYIGTAFLFLSICNTEAIASDTAHPPYVLLLDVSGSMERDGGMRYSRYSSGQVTGIVRQLSRSIAAADDHPAIYVQPFSSSRDQSIVRGPFDAEQVLNAIPKMATGKETELDSALALGQQVGSDSYLFILTDNKNDFAGSQNDRQFYDLLAKSPTINTVYFIPLAQAGAQDALVLYAIASGAAHRSVLLRVVSGFAKAARSDFVQFRGFYDDKEQESLSMGEQVMQSDENGEQSLATVEGDSIVLAYDEGRPLDGALQFRIHSNLNHWRIKDGDLRRTDARIEVPTGYDSEGEYKLPIGVTGGRKINVAPDGDSAEIYTLPLSKIADAGVSLSRNSLFETQLPEITGQIRISAVVHLSKNYSESGFRPEFSESLKHRIEAVRNLPEIMNLMTFQPDSSASGSETERVIPINREILIRVKPSPLKNLLARSIKYGLPAMLLAALALIIFISRGQVYTITEPGERSKLIRLSLMTRTAALVWNGRTVASIKRAGRGFLISPKSGFGSDPANVAGNPSRFVIRNLKSGDKGLYSVRSGAAPSKATAQKGKL